MEENPCCLCLSQDKVVKSMFADEESDIVDKINALTGVQFHQFDVLPTGVCIDCLVKLEDAYKLRLMIINSYASLQFMYKNQQSPDLQQPDHESLLMLPTEMPLQVDMDVKAEELAFPSDEGDEEDPQAKEQQIKTLIELSRLLPPTSMAAPDASNPFPCQICGRWFGNKKAVVTHVIREHTSRKADGWRRKGGATNSPAPAIRATTFDCEVCGQPFENKSQVVTHVLQNHTATRNYQQRGSRKYHACLRCERRFTSQEQLLRHAVNCGQSADGVSSDDSIDE